jgi:hypothetical protein
MTKKIEAYLQKRVLKNYQALERKLPGELPDNSERTQVAA